VPELLGRISELEAQLASREPLGPVRSDADLVDLSDEHVLQDVGIYRYHHPLENATEYKDQLAALNEQIKEMVKGGSAVLASDMFTFNNSLAKGRKMTGEFSKLMLRAYNAEADNCVRALRAGNVVTAKKRLDSSVTAIAKLGSMMEMRINPHYHQLRYRELEMTADHLMKLQEEKEAAREERERLREERKAEQELAAERARLDKERNHYLNSLEALRAAGDEVGVSELSEKLSEIDQAIQQNDFRAANIRAGYVYVISNTGAFGSNMVKIGLTRRLEPMDRVRELGDASVPFPFDVHALFFSEDAVTVEAELHKAFAASRVNHVNQRREFFFATPEEVRQVLVEKVGNLLEFTDEPEATQYLQSKKYWGQ
jgi:cell division septum initiation protein DivIVA